MTTEHRRDGVHHIKGKDQRCQVVEALWCSYDYIKKRGNRFLGDTHTHAHFSRINGFSLETVLGIDRV